MEETSSSVAWDCKQLASISISSSRSASSQVVISNEDLLSEILSYVPVRTLICLKLVSKQWLSLITSYRFALLHNRRCPSARTSALFLKSEVFFRKGAVIQMAFVHLNLDKYHNNPFRYTSFSHDTFDPNKVCILQSCHGLLLCRTGIDVTRVSEHDRGLFYYYVYNPTTNQLATIDIHWSPEVTADASVLDFDPSKSPHYKVVFLVNTASDRPRRRRWFAVYLSETMTWKMSTLRPFVPPFSLSMSNLAYFKGSIYWISFSTAENLMLVYNVDEDRLATLPRPPQRNSGFRRRSLYFGESAGHLLIAEVFACAASFLDVYELNPDRSGWFLKFKVDLDQLSRAFPEMTHNRHTVVNEYAFSVLSLVRKREHFDEDSVLVLEVPGKAILYNLVHRSWKVLCSFCQADSARDKICGILKAIDYNESLACVTTASFLLKELSALP